MTHASEIENPLYLIKTHAREMEKTLFVLDVENLDESVMNLYHKIRKFSKQLSTAEAYSSTDSQKELHPRETS